MSMFEIFFDCGRVSNGCLCRVRSQRTVHWPKRAIQEACVAVFVRLVSDAHAVNRLARRLSLCELYQCLRPLDYLCYFRLFRLRHDSGIAQA